MDKRPASGKKKRGSSKIFLILMTSALLLMLASAGILSIKPSIAVAQQETPTLKDKVGAHLIWLSRENEAKMDEVLKTMADAGIKWLRTDFSWADIEPTYDPAQGHVFKWDAYDRMVDLAWTKYGINIVGILSGTPDWASSRGTPPEYIINILGIQVEIPKSAYPPSDPAMWSNFVDAVVSHFDGRVETWEIWNEPNLGFFKKYGYADNSDEEKADYENLVQLAYTAINGRAKLAMGALAGFGADGGGSGDPNAYLRKCLELGAANYADIISFHPYPENLNLYNNSHPHEAGMKQRLQDMRALIDDYSVPGKTIELWITEIGWTNTNDPWPAPQYAVDEDTQAAYTLRTYLSYLDDSDYTATDLKLTKIFYYNLWDQCFKECTAFKTTDNGSTWVRKPTRAQRILWVDDVNGFNGVDTFDGTNIWAVGNRGPISNVLGSANAGDAFWYQNSSNGNYLNGVSAASAGTAFAVGGNGTIMKTTGGGGPYVPWENQTSGTTNFLNGVSAVGTSNVFAVGDNGTILNTTNGGSNWSLQTSLTTDDLNSVSAVSSVIAWAVGQNGTILYTDNGGANWSKQADGVTTENLKSVSGVNESVCWAVGENGTILKTSNGGSSWETEASGTTECLNSVAALDAENAWAVGEDATVLRKSSGTGWGSKPTHASMKRLTGVVAVNSTTAIIVGYKDPWLENPDGLGIYPTSQNNFGLLDYLVRPTTTLNYLERLTVAGLAGDLFDNATPVAPDPLITNIVTNPTGASATLQKHVFQMPDGSLLVSLWNSNPDTSPWDQDASLSFTLTDASGSSTIYDNPVPVNLVDGATGALDPSVIVGLDANSNITVTNLAIGKTPVVLKYANKAACGTGSGAAVMLLGLMMGLMSLAGGRRFLRKRAS
jgi:photosystem II stability/assembly factor-like uncharacterized protein